MLKETPIKIKISKIFGEFIEYLYKDRSFANNLSALVFVFVIFTLINLMIEGFILKAYVGYFEYMVILSILFLFLNNIFINLEDIYGWGAIAFIFIGIAEVIFLFNNTLFIFPLAYTMIVILATGHLFYLFFQKEAKKK